MVFLAHTNTVILLEPYCGTITEPGLPVVWHPKLASGKAILVNLFQFNWASVLRLFLNLK